MVKFRDLPIFSLGVDFAPLGPPMIFRISAAKELAIFTLVKMAQTTLAVPVLSLRFTGIPEMLKLHWLKSTLAQKQANPFIQRFKIVPASFIKHAKRVAAETKNLARAHPDGTVGGARARWIGRQDPLANI